MVVQIYRDIRWGTVSFFRHTQHRSRAIAYIGHSSKKISVGRGDSSHFPHIYNSTKTGGAGIVCSSVMVVPHMTFMQHMRYYYVKFTALSIKTICRALSLLVLKILTVY